jgi:hypothetical protein
MRAARVFHHLCGPEQHWLLEQLSMSDRNSTVWPPCVYFVRFGEFGPIKIGKTDRDPRIRLGWLQNGSPVTLRLLAVINEPDEEHSEEALHRRFAHLRIRGEWFDSTRELTDFIAEHAEPWTVTSRFGRPRDISYRHDFDCQPDESCHWDRVLEDLAECRVPRVIRPRGRPMVNGDPVQRARHVACAGLVLFTSWSMQRIADSLSISRETVYQWYKLALGYDCPESEALRQLAAKRPRSRR